MKSFESWDQTVTAYQERGERTPTPPGTVGTPEAVAFRMRADGAIADPRFKQSIVDFLALTPE
jgi:hypothetical protein